MQDQHTFFVSELSLQALCTHPPTPHNISVEATHHLQNAFCFRSVFLLQTSPPPPFLSLHHLRNATQTSQHNSVTSIYYMYIIYGQCYKHTQNVNTSSQKSTTPEQISLMLSLHHPPWKRVSAEEDADRHWCGSKGLQHNYVQSSSTATTPSPSLPLRSQHVTLPYTSWNKCTYSEMNCQSPIL